MQGYCCPNFVGLDFGLEYGCGVGIGARVIAEECFGGVRAFDLESLASVVCVCRSDVVHDARGEEEMKLAVLDV